MPRIVLTGFRMDFDQTRHLYLFITEKKSYFYRIKVQNAMKNIQTNEKGAVIPLRQMPRFVLTGLRMDFDQTRHLYLIITEEHTANYPF
nr:hypothetical protein Itr_chr05CG04940 [Ipomoea trifida]